MVERGVVEHWEVWNYLRPPAHFHVHATQFRVLARSTGPVRVHEGGLKDTSSCGPARPSRSPSASTATPGLYLLHCHNLEHEDAGMMSNFEVR